MGCELNPNIVYTEFTAVIRRQKEVMYDTYRDARIIVRLKRLLSLWISIISLFIIYLQIIKKLIERKQSEIRKVHPGLTCFRDGVREIPVESIPGIRDAGWKGPPTPTHSSRSPSHEQPDPDYLHSMLKSLLNSVSSIVLLYRIFSLSISPEFLHNLTLFQPFPKSLYPKCYSDCSSRRKNVIVSNS